MCAVCLHRAFACGESWAWAHAAGPRRTARPLHACACAPLAGLGWMMRRELWQELGPHWPLDHWVRLPPARCATAGGAPQLAWWLTGGRPGWVGACHPCACHEAPLRPPQEHWFHCSGCCALLPSLAGLPQDHWMRDEEVSKGRECVCPEVNRNKNIGEASGGRGGAVWAAAVAAVGGLLLMRWHALRLRPSRLPLAPAWPHASRPCNPATPPRPCAVRQVGANMNKQAFKRYLQTMSWNENETVRGVAAGTAARQGSGCCSCGCAGARSPPASSRSAAVPLHPPAHAVQHPPPPAATSLPTPPTKHASTMQQVVDYGDLSYLHRDAYEAALRAELATAEPFEFSWRRDAPKPQARGREGGAAAAGLGAVGTGRRGKGWPLGRIPATWGNLQRSRETRPVSHHPAPSAEAPPLPLAAPPLLSLLPCAAGQDVPGGLHHRAVHAHLAAPQAVALPARPLPPRGRHPLEVRRAAAAGLAGCRVGVTDLRGSGRGWHHSGTAPAGNLMPT